MNRKPEPALPPWQAGPLRPFEEFLDLKEMEWPKNVGERLDSNFRYYAGNYQLVQVVCLALLCVIRPQFIIGVLLALALGYWLHVNAQPQDEARNRLVTAIGAGVLLLAFGGLQLAQINGAATILCFIHGFMRKRTIKNRTSTMIDRLKERLRAQ